MFLYILGVSFAFQFAKKLGVSRSLLAIIHVNLKWRLLLRNAKIAFAGDTGNPSVNAKEEFIKTESAEKILTGKQTGVKPSVCQIGQNVTMDRYNLERVYKFKYINNKMTK